MNLRFSTPWLVGGFLLAVSFRTLAGLAVTEAPAGNDFILFDGGKIPLLIVETNASRAIVRATSDLAEDFSRVTGTRPRIEDHPAAGQPRAVIIGEIGRSRIIDGLIRAGKLQTNGVGGQWESYVMQVVRQPLPGVESALVIAGSDPRGTIYGIYELSEMIGVSPWYWWADVPVRTKKLLALRGDRRQQDPPAVKYRGIFLNDEDWGLRPWSAKTFETNAANIGPKTYAKIFELLLRLRANYLWPAMHPGTAAFNSFPTNREIADDYGIVMGSSHCEQMLRDNVGEWDDRAFGEYNFVTNPGGVLKYWEQRLRENGKFENIYTLGMRGIHDGAMPGGGTTLEKADRLQKIIQAQREMLARNVNPDVAQVPQIFCPYKEVLELYRLMPTLPEDITLVWPDDNYGYIREYSDARERARSGAAGVYYHVSYWGRPRDYLWLCSTPPALIAEEMTKAYDYGANKVWVLNVGDLKPAELDMEFFLKLAWDPHSWNGTNTYELLERQLERDFGTAATPELTSILAEYYRLNFQRKPEHLGFPTNNLFSAEEARQRVSDWQTLVKRVDAAGKNTAPELQDAFFELVGYPVRAAALANERVLVPDRASSANDKIHRLTARYNEQVAGGKWRGIMSDNPRGQLNFSASIAAPKQIPIAEVRPAVAMAEGADFVEVNHRVVMEVEHASAWVPGKDARWQKIIGLGYNGESVAIFPNTAAVRDTSQQILAESPCLEYKIWLEHPGDWTFTVRALPTFSVEPGRPQRYAIGLDDESPKIVALPFSLSETDRRWQENVLRNATLTTSIHALDRPGRHTLKIWMVDPGVVLDTIFGGNTEDGIPGYVGPAETKISK